MRADHMVLDGALRESILLVATQSGHVDVLDWRRQRVLAPLLVIDAGEKEFPATVSCVAVSPSGTRVAVAASDDRLRFWRFTADGRPETTHQFELARVTTCRFVDDDRLFLGHMTGEVSLFDVTTGEERFRRQLDYDPVYALAMSPNGKQMAVALRSSRVQLIDISNGETASVLRGHRDSVFGLAWLSGTRLATASKDKRLLVWDLNGSEPRVLYRDDHYITALAADRVRGRLAIALQGDRIKVIDLLSGRVTHVLDRHTAPVQVLRFTDGGRRLLSAGNDARVLVWDVSDGGAS